MRVCGSGLLQSASAWRLSAATCPRPPAPGGILQALAPFSGSVLAEHCPCADTVSCTAEQDAGGRPQRPSMVQIFTVFQNALGKVGVAEALCLPSECRSCGRRSLHASRPLKQATLCVNLRHTGTEFSGWTERSLASQYFEKGIP